MVLRDDRSGTPLTLLHRFLNRFHYEFTIGYLKVRNRCSRQALTGTSPHAVSLTTFGDRIEAVYLAIESIGAGYSRPQHIVLWLDERRKETALPSSLKRLTKRGLQIGYVKDVGPHTKYYPYVVMYLDYDYALTLADDDTLYPKWWLQKLAKQFSSTPKNIVAYRAHRASSSSGVIDPYMQWSPASGHDAKFSNFATATSGYVIPKDLAVELRNRGERFLELSPRADDVWVHAVATDCGIPTAVVEGVSRIFPTIRGTQHLALAHTNNLEGLNDSQIRASYTTEAIARIEADQK
jgi:hypothetical protein